jgi:hypothetical protein
MRRAAGWSACGGASLWIIGNVSLLLFYTLELPKSLAGGTEPHIFGPLSDFAGLFSAIVLLPLPVALYQLTGHRRRGLSWVAMTLGVLGLLTTIVAQTLLVAHVIDFEANLPFSLGGLALLGAWMFLVSRRGRAAGFLSARLARLGELTGASLALVIGLVLVLTQAAALNSTAISNFGAFVQRNGALIGAAFVLVILGALSYFLGVPIWLIELARRLLAAPLTPYENDRPPVQIGAPR